MSVLETLSSIIVSSLPEPHAGLLLGMLFGTKATLPKVFLESLITTGTIHIVALSGMNITMIITFVQLLLLRFLKRPIANIVSVCTIIGFIGVVGPSASVLRAAIMGCISLFAITAGRKNIPMYTLILAVIIMLLLNPLWVMDISFQLSVCATLGIILFVKKDMKQLSGATSGTFDSSHVNNPVPKRGIFTGLLGLIEDDLRVTLAAQVFTIPIILFQFHRISLVAPVANVLIGWLIAPIMIIGCIQVAVGLVWLPFAQIVGLISWALLSMLMTIITATARIPFASISF